MGAKTKRAAKIRTASEFEPARLRAALESPTSSAGLYAWALADIFAARSEQMLGRFKLPARMAEAMRTDDALAVAFENRLAPQRCIKVELVPAKGARGASIAGEAEALFGQNGVGIAPGTMASVHECLVNHDVAFATCTATPRADGTRVDFTVNAWPIEFVRWDATCRCFKTQTAGGVEVTIVHGDGRWIVFDRFEIEPFKHAALLSAAVVWARHAFAARDWTKGSVAHGSAKAIGEMPEGVALLGADGALTQEAAAFLALLRSIPSADAPVGIKPFGSKIDFLTNNSQAWQIWEELVANAEQAAAKIYLGTDGTLGSKGGAPGVDIESLFGVAATRVEGDLTCIERGILTGVIEPWCAMNFGDSSLAPMRRYMVPDGDEAALKASLATRSAAFYADLKGLTDAHIPLTQEMVDGLAADYGVRAPKLPPVPSAAGTTAGPAATPALRIAPSSRKEPAQS